MPFTPFHMGPGAVLKAAAGEHFSLTVFGFTQVAMDIEPLVRIFRDDPRLHGVTHTYAGALVIGLLCLPVGKAVCGWLLRAGNRLALEHEPDFVGGPIKWSAAAWGAVAGAISHVFLDSIMHADVQPWHPLNSSNALLHTMSMDGLHMACAVSGLIGGLVLLARARWNEYLPALGNLGRRRR